MSRLNDIGQDIRFGLRQLTRKPSLPALIILLLALGIGVNTAIFSVVKAVVIEPLPFEAPQQLMQIWHADERFSRIPVSGPNFLDWREQSQSFERIVTYTPYYTNLTGIGEPERIQATMCTSGLFEMLRVRPALGRTFSLEEEQPGKGDVAILSDSLWQRRFGAEPNLVGKTLTLNGESKTIIGIMPPGFHHPCPWSFDSPTEVWTPLSVERLRQDRGGNWLLVMGRLRDGTGHETAQEEMSVISKRLEEMYPDTNEQIGARVVPVLETLLGRTTGQLIFLLGAAGLVLLIACGNVAGLLIARAMTRQMEVAIRSSLGASRSRLVRQFVTENLPLFLIGGGLSVLLAYWGMGAVRSSIPSSIPRIHEIGIDVGVLVFSLGISLVTGLVFGLVPALVASKTDFVESLKQGRGTTQGGRSGLRQLLVISQFALTLILANGAALMLQSYWHLRYTDHGFDTEGILTLRLNLQGAKYEKASQVHAFYSEVVDQIESIPGVRQAAAINRLPLEGGYNSTMIIEGREDAFGDSKGPLVEVKPITPAYFEVMGIPWIAGRGLTPQDGAGGHIGVVINQTLARVGWPDESPIGQRFRYRHDSGPEFTVVGVVGDTRQWGLEREPISETYFPYTEVSALDMHTFREVEFIVVRTEIDPYSVVPDIRREIGTIDDDLPISDIRTTETLVTESIAKRRFNTILVILFATLGLVLLAAGIFGVMSFFVHQRTHEFGVRIALGANRSRVLELVLLQGLKLAGIGTAVGLLGIFATMKLTNSMIYGVQPTDPWTIFGGSLFLVAVGLLASVAPARRAIAVDPVLALRQE